MACISDIFKNTIGIFSLKSNFYFSGQRLPQRHQWQLIAFDPFSIPTDH
jgi:hypothetical protein